METDTKQTKKYTISAHKAVKRLEYVQSDDSILDELVRESSISPPSDHKVSSSSSSSTSSTSSLYMNLDALECELIAKPTSLMAIVNRECELHHFGKTNRKALETHLRVYLLAHQLAKERLQRLYSHLPFGIVVNAGDPDFIKYVYSYLTTDAAVLEDIRTMKMDDRWCDQVLFTIDQWMSLLELERETLKRRGEAVWAEEIRMGNSKLIQPDTNLEELHASLCTTTFTFVTKYIYGWSREHHCEFFKSWMGARLSWRKLPPVCGQCWSRANVLGKCKRCGLVFYCGKECQSKHWKAHKLVCLSELSNKL